MTNGEGRVIKHNKAVEPPGEARTDWEIICELARRLGTATSSPSGARPRSWTSCGSPPRARWPTTTASPTTRSRPPAGCSGPARPGPPGHAAAVRGRPLPTPTARPASRGRVAAPAEPPDEAYPLRLTTGRTVALPVRQPDPPAARPGRADAPALGRGPPSLGFADDDPVRVVTRRGAVTYGPGHRTDRPDTVFVPYHWAEPVAANVLTVDALDPISKMPEFKVCACRVERGQAVDPVPEPPMPPEAPYRRDRAAGRPALADLTAGKGDRRDMMGTTLFIDPGRWTRPARRPSAHDGDDAVHRPGPVHRLPGVRGRLPRVRLAPRQVHDPPGLHRRRADRGRHADGLHALRGPGGPVRRGLPGRRHPGHRRRGRPGGGQGALHRLRQLRRRLPVRGAQARRGRDAPVQVQPLLRPHLGRPGPDVRHRLPHRGHLLRLGRGAGGRPPGRPGDRRVPLRRRRGPHRLRGRRPRHLRRPGPGSL